MPNFVKATVSKKQLRLIPDISASANESSNGENEFDVTVINESDKFASFYLELLTIGIDSNSNVKWYTLDPEVSAKKPSGAQTNFHVIITKPPIQVYDTTIELTLRVFSVEYANLFNSQKLSLKIERPRKPLRIYLPIKEFKVYPEEEIEIPVILENLSQKPTDVKLSISGLDPDWLSKGTEQKLQIDALESEKTSFWCQPPKNARPPSGEYEFKIEAKSDTSSNPAREQGILEVLPHGTVEFSCTPKMQIIPVKRGVSRKQSKFATYELQFENDSNLPQRVNIQISEQDKKQCGLVIPEGVELAPGETKPMYLVAKKRRPWWWLKRRLLFEVSPILTNPDTEKPSLQIRANPSTQVLELQVLPIIPFWLQLVELLLLLLVLSLLWYLNPKDYHTGAVNSVRLIGNSSLVVSGSSDQTIRLWQVDRSPWQFDIRRLKYEGFIALETQKSVRVIRQSPREDYVIASGLENGDIKLWNVLSKRDTKPIYNGNDRVFDLAFTKDSRFLFSGHGSGIIRQWNLEDKIKNPRVADLNFTIYALALSETQPIPLIVVAGRYNRLALWDWFNRRIYELPYQAQNQPEKNRFNPIMGQHQYINSLTIADAKNMLVSGDNEGYITLWDLNQIRQCIQVGDRVEAINRNDENFRRDSFGNTVSTVKCDDAILDRWRDGHRNQPVRSVALTQNGCYLASVGDDGRVMLWTLEKSKRSPQHQAGNIIAQFPDIRLNSVDIKALDDNLFIATGDDNYRVKLYRVKGRNDDDNANCQ